MGRVARYKKIKACDPFAKGNKRVTIGGETVWGLGDDGRKPKKRSRTAEKLRAQGTKKSKIGKHIDRAFDAPPDDGDEFDMKDLLGSVKKRTQEIPDNEIIRVSLLEPVKTTTTTSTRPAPASNLLRDEATTNRLLKLEKQVISKDKNVHQGRMEGESKNAYRKRVANETRQIIKRENQDSNNPEKRKRKKEFLNNKKKAKKGKLSFASTGFDDDNDDDMVDDGQESTLVTGEQAYAKRALETQVQFGEQAERPPTFKQLPRKATPKNLTKHSGKAGMDQAQIEAEQKEMELMRLKVRAQYALIRAKRHQAGDFHL